MVESIKIIYTPAGCQNIGSLQVKKLSKLKNETAKFQVSNFFSVLPNFFFMDGQSIMIIH